MAKNRKWRKIENGEKSKMAKNNGEKVKGTD